MFTVVLVPVWLVAQTNYRVVSLPGLGGTAGQANSINNRDWASGLANLSGDSVGHAALWKSATQAIDLGSLGGADTNSAIAWPVKNVNGLVVGISDTADNNPLGEAFSCWPFFTPGAPTYKTCQGFRWSNGTMLPLPPFPGGYNSYATAANNRGQIVGWAENGVHDPSCNTAFQVLQFRAVIWQPDGSMQELPPLPGDSTSAATAINDRGEVVGISGACGIAVGGVSAAHAVLWEKGVPVNLGDLGGHSWNTPAAINNHGVIVGFSLPASQDGTNHYVAVMWTRKKAIQQLEMPSNDIRSQALGINEKGQIVGLSRAPTGLRAVLWEGGVFTDLNTLTLPGSPYLLYANDITDAGKIVGEAFDATTGASPAFVAVPVRNGGKNSQNQSPIFNGASPVPTNVDRQAERHAFALGVDPTQ
jgi:probable HAF family extracellular repeat protein